MTDSNFVELEWINCLIREAERDLVFLWHITSGHFGAPRFASDDLPRVVARAAAALIDAGCVVGFGDPDSAEWRAAIDPKNAKNPGAVIAGRWLADSRTYDFLLFARRQSG